MIKLNILSNKWWLLLINLSISILLLIINGRPYKIFGYTDILFYLSSFYLFIGLALFVVEGRFFDGITYGFRRFFATTSKRRDYLDDWEEKPLPSQKVNRRFVNLMLFEGSILLILMFILTLLFS